MVWLCYIVLFCTHKRTMKCDIFWCTFCPLSGYKIGFLPRNAFLYTKNFWENVYFWCTFWVLVYILWPLCPLSAQVFPKKWAEFVHQKGVLYTQNQAKIDILYTQTTKNRHFGVHFGFWCTFCGQKPTFFFYLIMIKSLYILYRFGEKSGFLGRFVHTRYFCTYKLCVYD